MRKVLKILGIVLGVLVFVVLIYLFYLFAGYERLSDNLALTVNVPGTENVKEFVQTGSRHSVMTYNIGYGSYPADYSFFMDGGKNAKAYSKKSVEETVTGALNLIGEYDPEFLFLQEVDIDADRSYHVDEYEMTLDHFGDYFGTYALNYDSPFLAYPIFDFYGKNRSGLASFSKYRINESIRRSLPVADDLRKFIDLDRCYSINRMNVSNGKELVLINVHMSVFGADADVKKSQMDMLIEDMKKECAAGNYLIVGGDFNHDLMADEEKDDVRDAKSHPFRRSALPELMMMAMDKVPYYVKEGLWPSGRYLNESYDPETTATITMDGFIVSDNVDVITYENVNAGYAYSDHDPVYMEFELK
ncbi:MAG: endonuclease/exonuclease/phosphatase family protein [Lachnospiraceae bacterium]|nr:endonuclease/exonuclease/phosphatase family protein [Lachnospiraceae bacterium]